MEENFELRDGNSWEDQLVKTVIKHSEKFGRPEYDKNHTLASYKWAKILGKKLDLDEQDRLIVNVASLLHDQGYDFRSMKDGQIAELDVVRNQKEFHLKKGSRISKKLYGMSPILQDRFNEDEWGQVVELVELHDKWRLLEEGKYPRLLPVLVAVDTFSQIDLEETTPTFNKDGLQTYFKGKLKGRIEIIKKVFKENEYIINTADSLYERYGEYIESLSNGTGP